MLLTSTPEHKQAKKVNEELKDSWHNAENQPFLKKINIPSDLTKICSGMEQWWNWVWYQWKVEPVYLHLQVISRWTNVEGENWRSSTILVCVTCPYPRKWKMLHATHHFLPSQGVLLKIPTATSHWTGQYITHHMGILDGWLWIHDPILQRMWCLPCQQPDNYLQWTQQPRWWLRTDAYGAPKYPTLYWNKANQSMDNSPMITAQMKNWSLCKIKRSLSGWWNMGQKKNLPCHMNSIFVGAWGAFKMSVGKCTRESFAKKKLPPLSPPDLTTDTQACTASIQVSSRSKAEEINEVSCRTVAYIEV